MPLWREMDQHLGKLPIYEVINKQLDRTSYKHKKGAAHLLSRNGIPARPAVLGGGGADALVLQQSNGVVILAVRDGPCC